MNFHRIFFGLSLLLTVGVVNALTVVHMETQLGSITSDIYYELYDEIAPNNVNNFMGYITRGDYDKSFFHRKAQYSDGRPFVVQGGGFTYIPQFDFDARAVANFGGTNLMEIFDPDTGELGLRPIGETYIIDANNDDIADTDASGNEIIRVNDGLKQVPVDTSVLPVLSEASLSNLRGTIAMALTSAGADSATNQWFVNLSDNTQLDPDINSDGFTVFGRVLGDGIDFFDTVNGLSTYPLASVVHPAFTELPVTDYVAYTLMLEENLVRLNSAREVMSIDVTDHDFGFVNIGQTAQTVITLTVSSDWQPGLDIGNVGDVEILDSPFRATTDCESATIPAGGSCNITVYFEPVTPDNFEEVLDISFDNINLPNLPIKFTATSRTKPKVVTSTGNSLDFLYVYPGVPESEVVSVTNLGQQTLTFNSIVSDNTDNFITTDDCVSLEYNETCAINVTFSTQVEGLKTGLLSINTNAPETPFEISLQATGSLTIVPDIDAETVHDFGDLLNGDETSRQVTLTNRGSSDLELLTILLSGDNQSDFTSTANCITVLTPGESCALMVVFKPLSTGSKKATLKIGSDDPDEPEIEISLIGTSSSDSDNIPDFEEDGAPNKGDGDSDSVLDKYQSNIVSMLTESGSYITMTTTSFMSFQNTAIVDNPSPGDMPGDAEFDIGIISFSLALNPPAPVYKLGMILPVEQKLEKIYQYGPTPDNPVPHWYEFMFDAETATGAQIFNNVTMTTPDGRAVQRNIVQIWYADGKRGDDDLTVNGSITSTNAVSVGQSAGDAPGSLSGYFAILISLLLLSVRRTYP